MSQEKLDLEARIAAIEKRIGEAQEIVQQWVDANTNLARSVAEARAETQGTGRGLLGAVLGSGFRSAMRTAAASANAAIAKDVAEKRRKIVDGKRVAQEYVRTLKAELASSKARLKELVAAEKRASKSQSMAAKSASDSLSLLQKLKDAYDAGILTQAEYEEKRRKLVSTI